MWLLLFNSIMYSILLQLYNIIETMETNKNGLQKTQSAYWLQIVDLVMTFVVVAHIHFYFFFTNPLWRLTFHVSQLRSTRRPVQTFWHQYIILQLIWNRYQPENCNMWRLTFCLVRIDAFAELFLFLSLKIQFNVHQLKFIDICYTRRMWAEVQDRSSDEERSYRTRRDSCRSTGDDTCKTKKHYMSVWYTKGSRHVLRVQRKLW